MNHAMTTTMPQPVRVMHLVCNLEMGGLEHVVIDLTARLDRARFDPSVVCLEQPGALADRCRANGVPVEHLGASPAAPFRVLPALARLIRARRPHVLHTHNVKAHVQGTIAAALGGTGVKVVNTKHGQHYPESRRARLVNRLLWRRAACLVGVSRDAAELARTTERVPGRKVRLIYNGIDALRMIVADPRANPHRAIHVARLNAVKDQATLLQAVKLVVDVESRFTLDIVGDGPERAALAALAASLQITRSVRFLGFRDDVATLLAEAGQFVLSSRSEGVSLTLLEAMAAGLPVVATNVGGNPEVVQPGATGLLVPAESPRALADAMLTLARDSDSAMRMGLAGRKRVLALFSLDAMVRGYQELYDEVLATSAAARTAAEERARAVAHEARA